MSQFASIPLDENDISAVQQSVRGSLASASAFDAPYRHWICSGFLPDDALAAIRAFNAPPPDLGGVSGKRELHNDQRRYIDAQTIASSAHASLIAHAFQDAGFVRDIAEFFGADLNQTYLRIEFAQDVAGFWLKPHTDLGVKRLTILHYLSDEPGQSDLGTDIYDGNGRPVKRTPFAPNIALAFVPGEATYHGFEERPIAGVRKSLIFNYVTHEWRDKDQLAFPARPVTY